MLVARLINVAGFNGINIANRFTKSLLDMVLEDINFIVTRLSLPNWRLAVPQSERAG